MESELGKLAISQGIWCALFVALFFWTLKSNAKRENSYQEIIKALSDDIKDRLRSIEEKLSGRR